MAERAIVPTPKTFAELVTAVRAALITGQSRVDRAYLDTYRNTGQFIAAHLLFHEERAAYGAQVVPRLARSLNVDERLLYRCLKFVREYPILSGRTELGWTHYRLLMEVPDKTQRRMLESAARTKHWKADELERRVRAVNAIDITPTELAKSGAPPRPHQPLEPQRGTPGLHLIVEKSVGRAVDLGFRHYWPLTAEQAKRYAKGDIVRIGRDDSLRSIDGATKADLFTYAAQLVRVVDGDTLVVALEISPGEILEQKLRLRGLDCPELSTPEGKAAKRFVEALMTKTTAIVINTTKPDKYDRYLADVFLMTDAGEIYLNNALLENGQAVRKDAEDFGDDWGFK